MKENHVPQIMIISERTKKWRKIRILTVKVLTKTAGA